jgi:peptidoglycan/xylan/chitin deacetylase (PgdA/CDA1 family)
MFTLQSSWDDGHKLDIRLSQLLLKYSIPATFYISNINPKIASNYLLDKSMIKDIADSGFIIGGHTFSHVEDLKVLSDDFIRTELETNKEWLEDIVDYDVVDFCPPSGKFDNRIVDIASKCGYQTLRTTNVMNTDIPSNMMNIQTTIHVNPIRKEYKGRKWFEIATEKLSEALAKGDKGYYHLWGHSHEVEKYDLWNELEHLLKIIKSKL